jgi:hypothetical protein
MNYMDFFVTSVQKFATKRNLTNFSNLKKKIAKDFILNQLTATRSNTCCIIHLLPIHLSNKTLVQKCKATRKFNVPIKTASEFCYN